MTHKIILSAFLCFIPWLAMAQSARPQEKNSITTFILVRHAEKMNDGSSDPGLLPEGETRSTQLAEMLKQTPVDAIYSTKFNRTKKTVTPLAEAKGISIQVYESLKVADLEAIAGKYKGGTVVIAGHSNTTPAFVNLLTGKDEYKPFADDAYDNLIIVSVITVGKDAKITWLKY
jgi:broad specificity phosphatase PhoE